MMRLQFAWALWPLFVLGCGTPDVPPGGGSGGAGGSSPLPPCTDCTPAGDLAFALPSPKGATLWTASPMDKVLREAAVPTTTGDTIRISAAKNEFEPFQIIVHSDTASTASMTMTPFTGPGTIDDARIHRVGYVKLTKPSDPSSIISPYMPDPLHPTTQGASHNIAAGENQPFWITVHIPPGAAAGDYTAKLSMTVGSETTEVPISLHVYDFELPKEIGFDGDWNSSFEALGGGESLAKVRTLKDFFYDHRLVPSGAAWPAGLNYNGGIDYDCASGKFVEVNNPYDFSQLGPEYIDGKGWNGVGFPSFQIMQFVNNSTPRPQTFCGVDRGPDHF